MVHGTKDITGKLQESICIHQVDAILSVHEELMGLCELVSSMTLT